jgi:glycosyltransferase involved in cell wall biosynthesis
VSTSHSRSGDERRSGAERLVVLESFRRIHERSDPYLALLDEQLRTDADVVHFSWGRALTGSYDVFHLHWPEWLLRGRSTPRSAMRGVLFGALLVRLRVTRRPLVRTLHNLEPHDAVSSLQRFLIRWSERWTTLWIVLNRSIEPPSAAPREHIPLGHLRDWHAAAPPPSSGTRRFLFFGYVRAAKGVDALLAAFDELHDPTAQLRIAGSGADSATAAAIHEAIARDPRVSASLEFLSDEQLREEVRGCEVVVAPFARVTNSGSVMVALSLDRPVLVPDVAPMRELAEEVGDDWVMRYQGRLSAHDLGQALERCAGRPAADRPDLSRREWADIGRRHLLAFERAVGLARAGRRLSRSRRR